MHMIPKYDKVLNHSFSYKQTLYRQRFPSQLSGRGPVRGILARYNPAECQEPKLFFSHGHMSRAVSEPEACFHSPTLCGGGAPARATIYVNHELDSIEYQGIFIPEGGR